MTTDGRDHDSRSSGPGEPTPVRDNGPYLEDGQARAQFDAVAFGIPTPTTGHLAGVSSLVLGEALLLTGVQVSPFEQDQRDALARQLDPQTVQVIAGWIVRAHLAGAAVRTAA